MIIISVPSTKQEVTASLRALVIKGIALDDWIDAQVDKARGQVATGLRKLATLVAPKK
jgi:hypothetical protein